MGYMTMYQESEVEVYMSDIISNINSFSDADLINLKEEIDSNLTKSTSRIDVLKASTMDEEYKIKILKEMFDKFSWEELEVIKKKIM